MVAADKVFSVVIYFIAFRESLEAAIVIGTLMGMLESLAKEVLPDRLTSQDLSTVRSADSDALQEKGTPNETGHATALQTHLDSHVVEKGSPDESNSDDAVQVSSPNEVTNAPVAVLTHDIESDSARREERTRLIKQMRKLVLVGAGFGILTACIIGAAFLAVFYTQTKDLWGSIEELWEGIFTLVAMFLITPVALAILRVDQSRKKWRKKLREAFLGKLTSTVEDDQKAIPVATTFHGRALTAFKAPFLRSNRGQAVLFTIPFITTLREGLEAVVFIGGVSLGLSATSIPLPAIIGLGCGFLCGFLVFQGSNMGKIRIALLTSTGFLLLIAAGMASRAIYYLQFYSYVKMVGDAAAESGSGPGSYDYRYYIWHIDCCNPEDNSGGNGYAILNALVGWNNTGTWASIFSYLAYWFVIEAWLLYSIWKQGRLSLAWNWKGKDVRLWESKKCYERRMKNEHRQSIKTA